MPATQNLEERNLHALLELTLTPNAESAKVKTAETTAHVASLTPEQRADFLKLADSHHVILRALRPLSLHAAVAGNTELAQWALTAIAAEEKRIDHAIEYLSRICHELEAAGCPATVMKSLDHWPDLGNDLDLYTSADPRKLVRVLMTRFDAKMEARSWGDRLANKWNFSFPDLKESVEFHVQRLGQTGEHTALAERFVSHRVTKQFRGFSFYVPAPEERVVVATLQRMYRHFYFRVCDIVNTAALVDSGTIDYDELRHATELVGIWPGVATYLVIVSGYAERYRGTPLALPANVCNAARFGAEKIRVRARFLRVPIMPEGAELFTRQVTRTAMSGDVPATMRLNLLPPLALAAAVAYKLTGSDKGVW